jgi:hypothetical protein
MSPKVIRGETAARMHKVRQIVSALDALVMDVCETEGEGAVPFSWEMVRDWADGLTQVELVSIAVGLAKVNPPSDETLADVQQYLVDRLAIRERVRAFRTGRVLGGPRPGGGRRLRSV